MLSPTQLFNHLVIGVQESVPPDQTTVWHYSSQLQRAANVLAALLLTRMPPTLTGLRQLLSEPVQQWWPAGWPIPAAFDSSFGILEDQLLSEEASAYYYRELVGNAALSSFQHHAVQLAVDNEEFRQIISSLREQRDKDSLLADRLQREYVLLRRFLIEQPVVSATTIAATFSSTRFVRAQQVGLLYEPCRGPLWQCAECGPLLRVNGRQRGIRPSVCSDHLPDRPGMSEVADAPDLHRIRPGIHWRTCFPGKPELFLYERVRQLAQQYPSKLAGANLWPGLDQYDLRVCFQNGEVWAVDVKDQRNAHRLGSELKAISGKNDLPYNLGFYVIPDRWLGADPSYLRTAREQAALPENNQLLGMSDFIELLTAKLLLPTKKRRTAQ